VTVLDEIAAERQKQITKGYDAAHDDTHDRGELRLAAASYALRAGKHGDQPLYASVGRHPLRAERNFGWIGLGGLVWPFEEEFTCDATPRERLIAAAALIVAEIERLDRLALASEDSK
jgi:hypothetical protein